MNRRRFLLTASAASVAMIAGSPRLSLAPSPPRVYRVARLASTPQNPTGQALAQAFRDGMRDLGYVEGENLILEERYANDLPGLTEPVRRWSAWVWTSCSSGELGCSPRSGGDFNNSDSDSGCW